MFLAKYDDVVPQNAQTDPLQNRPTMKIARKFSNVLRMRS